MKLLRIIHGITLIPITNIMVFYIKSIKNLILFVNLPFQDIFKNSGSIVGKRFRVRHGMTVVLSTSPHAPLC